MGPDAIQQLLDARPLAAAGVRRAAARALLDHVASAHACDADASAREQSDALLAWALAEGTPADGRPVLGLAQRLAPSRAALLGGFRAHLLDLDDTHEDVRGHPTAVLVPALLALADPDAPLDEVLAAYVVGLEVMARLGRALGSAHYAAGFHPTATTGAVGAAAAGAHLLSLDSETSARAVSIAASRSAGLRAQFGTPGKPLHAGIAAQAGVEAVQWACAGIGAAGDAVTGENGLLAAHGVPADARHGLLGDLADPSDWAVLHPGLWFKRHPFCSAAMSAADAAAAVADELEGTPAERRTMIARVRIRMRPGADAALVYRRPVTGEQARFSAEAIVAMTLLGVPTDLAQLSPAPLDDEVTALLPCIVREHVERPAQENVEPSGGEETAASRWAPRRPRRDFWASVVVELVDGRTLEAQVDRPLGAPEHPLPDAVLQAKLAGVVGASRAAAISELLMRPDEEIGGGRGRTATDAALGPGRSRARDLVDLADPAPLVPDLSDPTATAAPTPDLPPRIRRIPEGRTSP